MIRSQPRKPMVRRIAREEGSTRTSARRGSIRKAASTRALSGAGALGLAQLMPGTAADIGVTPLNIEQNLRGGAHLLQAAAAPLQRRCVQALAAYNLGPGNVQN